MAQRCATSFGKVNATARGHSCWRERRRFVRLPRGDRASVEHGQTEEPHIPWWHLVRRDCGRLMLPPRAVLAGVSGSRCLRDPAILRRMRLRTASALDAHGVQPDVHWTSGCRTQRTISSSPLRQIKKPPKGWHFYLVEAAGIEPASASPLQKALHA